MNGSCANGRTINRETLETRVLEGLRDRLMVPEAAAEAMRVYAEETNRLNHERRANTDADRRELDKIARSLKEMLALIEEGSGSRAIVARMRELEAREDELKARLDAASVDLPDIHPNAAGIYRRKVERLAGACFCLGSDRPAVDARRRFGGAMRRPLSASSEGLPGRQPVARWSS
jgi:site-specific DNA recombinase